VAALTTLVASAVKLDEMLGELIPVAVITPVEANDDVIDNEAWPSVNTFAIMPDVIDNEAAATCVCTAEAVIVPLDINNAAPRSLSMAVAVTVADIGKFAVPTAVLTALDVIDDVIDILVEPISVASADMLLEIDDDIIPVAVLTADTLMDPDETISAAPRSNSVASIPCCTYPRST
jgi:hypothetical protein